MRPRAPLPAGVTNTVTPAGLAALVEELRQLDEAWPRLPVAERQARGRPQLEERLASAVLVDSKAQPRDEVRFGARVLVEDASGAQRSYQFVGIDEADATAGEGVTVSTPRGNDELTVISIAY